MRYFSMLKQMALLMLFLMCVQVYAQDDVKRMIAVMEFEAKGVTQIEASTLTDRFRSELVRTEKFKQIERSRIQKIFDEQKLQMSGMVSDDKLVEIGELLGAELLVVGSIGKLGATYTIDLRLVEVATGEIVASYFRDHRGEVDGLLEQFRLISAEIAGKQFVRRPLQTQSDTSQAVSQFTSVVIAEAQAREHAKEDHAKLLWAAGGVASGAGGSCLFPGVGGALGAGAAAGAGYMADASPPASRLIALENEPPDIREAYIRAYEKQLKKSRSRSGGGGGALGCCLGIVLVASLLTSAAGG